MIPAKDQLMEKLRTTHLNQDKVLMCSFYIKHLNKL